MEFRPVAAKIIWWVGLVVSVSVGLSIEVLCLEFGCFI